MAVIRRRRDNALLDAIEAHAPTIFDGTLWRVVRDGRSPVTCSRSGGRWDDGTFDVLYTSQEADGALAEMHFHLGRGQPVFPSKVRYHLHEIQAALNKALKLLDLAVLTTLGLDTARYGQLWKAAFPVWQARSVSIGRCPGGSRWSLIGVRVGRDPDRRSMSDGDELPVHPTR